MDELTYDIETEGLSKDDSIILVTYKFNDGPTKMVFIDEGHDAFNEVEAYLADPKLLKVTHGGGFDDVRLTLAGLTICGPHYDTMLAYHYRYPFREKKLDKLKSQVLGIPESEVLTLKQAKAKYNCAIKDLPKEFWEKYGTQDVDTTYALKKKLNLTNAWLEEVEFPLMDATKVMELEGMGLDKLRVAELHGKFSKEIEEIEQQFPLYVPKANRKKTKKIWKHKTIISSPKELREWLVDQGYAKQLALYLTDGGQDGTKKEYSTNKVAIKGLAKRTEIGKTILRYRMLTKLVSTYLGPWLDKDRIYPSYNQAGTKSGRYSSSRPNGQQIPIRTPEGKAVRSCIIPRPRHKFVVADLSQIEPKLLWAYSGCTNLYKALTSGDFHTFVQGEINKYGVDVSRFEAKTCGLATIYGAGVEKLQNTLEGYDVYLSMKQVGQIRDAVKKAFPTATEWGMGEWNRCFPRKTKWSRVTKKPDPTITTIGGRVINFDYQVNPVNYRMQGSCSDIIKIIMLNLYRAGYRIVGMVHDEVIIETPIREAEASLNNIKRIMEHSFFLPGMPLTCDAKIVSNWAEAK